MICPRCKGLLIYIQDLVEGERWNYHKCVNCGERIDYTIMKNRREMSRESLLTR